MEFILGMSENTRCATSLSVTLRQSLFSSRMFTSNTVDTIMAVLSPLHFGILLIAHVALGVPWGAKPAARYEGYDLERGPVLYEAYYPEEQDAEGESPEIYQEKRYFDRLTVPERSYQISEDLPYELPFEPEETEIHDEYVRPNSGYLAAFTGMRPQTVQRTGYNEYDQRNKEYIFTDQPMERRSNRNHLRSAVVNDYSFPGLERSGDYVKREEDEAIFFDPNQMSIGGDVQRIVPINDEFIFGEPSVKKVPDFKQSLTSFDEKEVFSNQKFASDYNQRKEIRPMPMQMENIFEPRPQTINYIFSAPKKSEKSKPVVFESESEDNDWPRNYGDNMIQAEIKKADEEELKNQEAKIDSIEVSQESHHKIRHHHGERPKRKYVHQ